MNLLTFILPILAGIGTLLGGLKAGGVNIGSLGNDALNVVDGSQIDITNYEAGQAVTLSTISVGGVAGHIYAIADNGPVAQQLGL